MDDIRKIKTIEILSKKYPNDVDFGGEVRKFIFGSEIERLGLRLSLVQTELIMKDYSNGWLIEEYKAEEKILIKKINSLKND